MYLLQGYISSEECTSSHLSPGIRNCPRRKPQGSFFSSVLGLRHIDFVPFSLYHFVVTGLCACCSLFGEFFLFFSYPFQHTSFTWIAVATPFEVNSSATFLGYFLSPCSFVSYSPRIVFFLSSFLSISFSLCLPLSVSFSLFLSFIVEFVGSYFLNQGLILGPWQSPNLRSAREFPMFGLSHAYLRLGSLIC